MMRTAILIDGAFFIKMFRKICPDQASDPRCAADKAFSWALLHLDEKKDRNRDAGTGTGTETEAKPSRKRDLYRIFFYDCPPLDKKLHNPISKVSVDLKKSAEYAFRTALHRFLLDKRKVALRLGHISPHTPWTIRPEKIEDILKGRLSSDQLTSDDVILDIHQKGVDMRIGLDIASLAYKRQVEQIVLFAGDADFVPAAKLARREGIDFILDPMWKDIPDSLREHIDGLRSTCPKPSRAPSS